MFTLVDFKAFVEDKVCDKRLTHVPKAETFAEVTFVYTGVPDIQFSQPYSADAL